MPMGKLSRQELDVVSLFWTCLVDALFPEVGEATIELLHHAGVKVEFPLDQTCCGQPAFNAGFWPEARQMAMHTIQVLEKAPGPVVIPSGSCTAMIRHGYLELFAEDPAWLARAKALADRTFELTEFLVDEAGIVDFEASFEGSVAYHPSCHLLRWLGVDRQPLALLGGVQGSTMHRLEAECCGFGGVFAVEHSEISGEMLKRKLHRVLESGARVVTGCDVSCLMQIEGGLRHDGHPIRCAHIAQLLTGREPGLR
jgi:L-lactate dehydrogenase complex protein LldE